MPLWKINAPVNAYTPEDRDALAEKISDLYGWVMPRFYAKVIFRAVAEEERHWMIENRTSPRTHD